MDGPQTKFCENHNCEVQTRAMKMGANDVAGLGIKKISFDKNLTRSTTIWKDPFRPIKTGPTLLITYAKIFLSARAINNKKSIDSRQTNNPVSLIISIIIKREERKNNLTESLRGKK